MRRASLTIQNHVEKYTGLHCSIGEMKQVLSPKLKKISTVSSSLAGTITFSCHELKDISALAYSEFATLPCGNRRSVSAGGDKRAAAGEIALSSDVLS